MSLLFFGIIALDRHLTTDVVKPKISIKQLPFASHMKKSLPRVSAIGIITSLLAACTGKQPAGEIQGLAGLAIDADRAMAGLQRKVTEIDGFQTPYLTGGQGEPLVLIHGFGGSKDNFNRVSKHLLDKYTVYAFDLPGFGAATRKPDADYTIPTQVQRLHGMIKSLGLKKPHLGGNSMGGWIVGAYAATYPDEVASVWFLAPAGMAASRKSEALAHYYKTGESLLLAKTREDYHRIVDLVMTKKPAFAPDFVVNAMADRAMSDRPLHKRIYDQFKQAPSDLPEMLSSSNYSGPALIVWGKQDRVLDVDGAAELKNALPQAELILLDETGHVPMIERPEQVANDYKNWQANLMTNR